LKALAPACADRRKPILTLELSAFFQNLREIRLDMLEIAVFQ